MEKEKTNVMHSTDISSRRTSQKSDPVLSCENLSRQVSGNWIWREITIHLNPGEKLALTGSSGSGKSLLLRMAFRALFNRRHQLLLKHLREIS